MRRISCFIFLSVLVRADDTKIKQTLTWVKMNDYRHTRLGSYYNV
ncbi:hypothetical protein SAMN02745781_03306 [Vibrio gazogenes DSM 21264]|uniref:Uncharacterized protein n=1 Tax=Vibrio gazogenes DSM 21264 = NBRC 103151 TaxID=1123492 RepID=A0A1M5EYW0_VIBGA|nr:hypothetical protein SAMN02745781_03306 [Vibrio gazogenes DSM 21264] [Vibrio gazogenes DSM 21264 = NBRC 103151]SJN55148.1 hypothetical protein BQ6471_01399 [Vibrio gazogenes]